MDSKSDSPLNEIKVLDLSEDRGLYAGRLLADFGADVIKVEEPGGSRARRIGPFKADNPGLESSLYFIHFNMNKRGITLNVTAGAGQEIFKRLVERSDVVIEDFDNEKRSAWRVDYSSLKKINRGIIVASVTGFGLDGPYSNFKAPDIVNYAMGGSMYTSGEEDRAPVVAPCEQAYHSASAIASFSIMTAFYERLSTGKGQHIEISSHEVLASMNEELIMRYSVTSEIEGRFGSQYTTSPGRIYPCKDGFVHVMTLRTQHWRNFVKLIGEPEMLMGEVWDDSRFRRLNTDIIDSYVTEFTSNRTKAEIVELCQSNNITCIPVNTPEDFSKDPHILGRNFIRRIEHPAIGEHEYFRTSYTLSETPCQTYRDAPLLGQHNEEVYCGELEYSNEQLAVLKSQGIM